MGLFTIFNLVNASGPILLLPFLTTYLSPESYGIIDLFNNSQLLLFPLLSLSINTAINRFYFDNKMDFSLVISSSLLLISSIGILFVIVGFFLNDFYTSFFSLNIDYNFTLLIIIYTFCLIFFEIRLGIWRVKRNVKSYGIFRISKTIIEIALTVYFIIYLQYDYNGRIFSYVITSLLFLLISLIFLIKQESIKIEFNKSYLKQILAYSTPIVFHTYGAVIINYSDRFFIPKLTNLNDLGVYAVGYQIGLIVSLLQNSINQAYAPYLFEQLSNKLDKVKYRKHAFLYSSFLLIITLVLGLIIHIFFDWFIGEEFKESEIIIYLIMMAFFFNGIYKFFVNFLFYHKNTKILSLITVFVGVLNLILNYTLISAYGIIGAAYATIISYFLLMILVVIVVNKYFKIFSIN